MNRAKNVDKELLAEPFGDAAMKDHMKTDGYLAHKRLKRPLSGSDI